MSINTQALECKRGLSRETAITRATMVVICWAFLGCGHASKTNEPISFGTLGGTDTDSEETVSGITETESSETLSSNDPEETASGITETGGSETVSSSDDDPEKLCIEQGGTFYSKCLCVVVTFETDGSMSFNFIGDSTVYRFSCGEPVSVCQQQEDGTTATVLTDVRSECYYGCYVDGHFQAPHCDEGCDMWYPVSFNGVGINLVEFAKVGRQEAPLDVDICLGENDSEGPKPQFPVYEQRPVSGQLTVIIEYFAKADCSPMDELEWSSSWDILEQHYATYQFTY